MISSTPPQVPEAASATAVALGAALKSQRKRTRQSLQALGNRVGLSTSTLSRYECGQSLPSEEHLDIICDVLKIPAEQRLELVNHLQQARINSSVTRQTNSSAPRHPPHALVTAISRYWRTTVGAIIIVFALIGVAATVEYLLPGKDAGSGSTSASSPISAPAPQNSKTVGQLGCDRYTVGASTLALRDFYGGPTVQLPRGEALTVIQRSHPQELPYWEVATHTNQQGWVDFRYLRPACE